MTGAGSLEGAVLDLLLLARSSESFLDKSILGLGARLGTETSEAIVRWQVRKAKKNDDTTNGWCTFEGDGHLPPPANDGYVDESGHVAESYRLF